MTNEDLQQIQNLVTSAHRVLVLTHKNPSIDTMASALSLFLALSKMGKDVVVAMESLPLVEVSNLVGIDQVKTTLSGKNLQVTYKPYVLGDFEKVSYLENQGTMGENNDSFSLTITPREGFSPDPKNFRFSYTGGTADLIITIEVLEPPQLGALYDGQLFAGIPVINIDNHDPNKDYGKFNLVEPDAASISEIVTFFLRAINAQIDADIAGNLYQGIAQASQNFQSQKVAAATFEAAAICLRAGAKNTASGQPTRQQNQNVPVTPGPREIPVSPDTKESVQPGRSDEDSEVPQDWTQPKSYRGTSSV